METSFRNHVGENREGKSSDNAQGDEAVEQKDGGVIGEHRGEGDEFQYVSVQNRRRFFHER